MPAPHRGCPCHRCLKEDMYIHSQPCIHPHTQLTYTQASGISPKLVFVAGSSVGISLI